MAAWALGKASRPRFQNAQSYLAERPAHGAVQERPGERMQQGRRPVFGITLPPRGDHFRQHLSRTLAKGVQHGRLVDTRDRAIRRAWLLPRSLPLQILAGIAFQRDGGVPPLLRAIVDQSVLADVEEPASRAAVPVIGPALRDVSLKTIVLRK